MDDSKNCQYQLIPVYVIIVSDVSPLHIPFLNNPLLRVAKPLHIKHVGSYEGTVYSPNQLKVRIGSNPELGAGNNHRNTLYFKDNIRFSVDVHFNPKPIYFSV